MDNIGDPCIDGDEELGMQGRISNLSAESVCYDGEWNGDSYVMWIIGKIREAKVFGEYVCGIEPANSLVRGRKEERERGNLKFIKPGEILKYRLEFNILGSKKEIENLKFSLSKN